MDDENDSKRNIIIFAVAAIGAGIILSTVVFPFWNLIREDMFEDAVIISSFNGKCYVNTSDKIPKTIENCNLEAGTPVKIKYGRGLAWASIVEAENGT